MLVMCQNLCGNDLGTACWPVLAAYSASHANVVFHVPSACENTGDDGHMWDSLNIFTPNYCTVLQTGNDQWL